MSSQVFPTFAGLGWDIERVPMWDTIVQESQSGKETRIANWSYPRWQWTLAFNALRQGAVHGVAYTELQQLAGFYNARQGRFDSFLYTADDDNSVTAQALGVGDGVTAAFQLVRAWGGFVEPVLAPNVVSKVYVDGVDAGGANWSVSNWGSASPGIITFAGGHIPTAGQVITADFTYYFPCRFVDDNIVFNKFVSNMYEGKKISFISLKS